MANDIVLSTARELGYTEARLELVRATAAQGCDDFEVAQLLIVAHETGLSPLRKQIYLIKRWNSRLKREVATPQTSIDGYRAIADRTQRYAPGHEPTYTYDDNGNLLSATAYVKKLAGGTWHEIAATAYWNEYAQTDKNGNVTQFWAKMPHVMLSKVAETLALRRAFPGELSGIYTHEEMQQADHPDVVDAPYVEPMPVAAPSAPASQEQIDTVRELGFKFYRRKWSDSMGEFLLFASDGRTDAIQELRHDEAQKAIDYLTTELSKRKAAVKDAQADPQPA